MARDDRAEPDRRTLVSVIGENAREKRLAAGLTLDQVSIAARARGLNWSESRVADFEGGRVAPNLATLIAACLALADAGCGGVSLNDLLRSASFIELNGSLSLTSHQAAAVLGGGPSDGETTRSLGRRGPPMSAGALMPAEWVTSKINEAFKAGLPSPMLNAPGATEERVTKALGISAEDLARLSNSLWGCSFSAERDRRADEGANAQKRGQITRQMRAELEKAMEDVPHGDDK